MQSGFIAFHYPKPEHLEEFVDRTRQVRDTLQASPGCLSAEIWVTSDGDAVVTNARFATPQELQQALAAGRALGDVVAFDDRERKPRQLISLTSR
ncbi:antibiotic biosynthesis monooxygenase family protein [Kribbella sp. NPDC050124]|uniref:antibiotic biosynthesis monooxygenase family protein n=1 Tax=Kribbella sp. NPDC050124 TaxID=3364114 RepID=UPI0037AFF8BC